MTAKLKTNVTSGTDGTEMADAEPVLRLPALKREWPMFLGWSEANEFLMVECRLRVTEARRFLGGRKPRIRLQNSGGGFKRWHQKTLLDFRRNLFENRGEGSDEG